MHLRAQRLVPALAVTALLTAGCDQLYLNEQLPQPTTLSVASQSIPVWTNGYYTRANGVGSAENVVSIDFRNANWPSATSILELSISSASAIPVPTGSYLVQDEVNYDNPPPSYAEAFPMSNGNGSISSGNGSVSVTFSTTDSISGAFNADFVFLDGGTASYAGDFMNVPLVCQAQGC
jgi:hypothetical protein